VTCRVFRNVDMNNKAQALNHDKDNRSKCAYALTRMLNAIVLSFSSICLLLMPFVTFDPRSVARYLVDLVRSVVFCSFILLLVRWRACSYIQSSVFSFIQPSQYPFTFLLFQETHFQVWLMLCWKT